MIFRMWKFRNRAFSNCLLVQYRGQVRGVQGYKRERGSDMEGYRKKVLSRTVLFAGLALLAAAVAVYNEILPDSARREGEQYGFQYGLTMGIGLLAVLAAVFNGLLLKNEKRLQMALNRERDERLKAIRAKAGIPMILITSVMMIAAGIIAGYFNQTIFVTLIAAGGAQLLLACGVKLYYMKTM